MLESPHFKTKSDNVVEGITVINLYSLGFEPLLAINDGENDLVIVYTFNPLVPSVHGKVRYSQTNMQLRTTGLLKYGWPFNGHHDESVKCTEDKLVFPVTWVIKMR